MMISAGCPSVGDSSLNKLKRKFLIFDELDDVICFSKDGSLLKLPILLSI